RAVVRARGGRYEITRFDVERGGAPSREEGAAADPTAVLERVLAAYRPVAQPGLPRFFGGAVGWVGYDVVRAFERLPSTKPDELALPVLEFVVTDTLVIFYILRQTVKVCDCALVVGDQDGV